MPRNPAAKKNQHNNRHENGLVGPGKRVPKQKSNGHLNGSVRPSASDEPIPTPTSTDSQANVHHAVTSPVTSDPDALPLLRKRHSESSSDGQEHRWDTVNGHATLSQRRSEMSQSKSKGFSEVNAVQVASTILKSCPAGDTVALLIVLLALPSMVLTIVQALFASLTLMPPTNVSPVSFLSLFDVFQGSAGSPSIGTMVVVDSICLGLWICLWGWAQNFALDIAQIQIAITLGNGNSGKNGTINMFCFALVLLQHSIRSPAVRRLFVTNLVPSNLLSNPRVAELFQFLPSEADFGDGPGPPSKIRSLFAIHILSQAFMAFVRRRVANSQNGSGSKASKRNDTEAYAGSTSNLEPLNVDAANAAISSGVDYQMPPTPGLRDSKDKLISAKKRRRQAHQVRSRQPFWAALASTKVHVLREVEHNREHPGADHAIQTSNASQSSDTVWITSVEPSNIQFEATCTLSESQDQESDLSIESRPFFVRINSARWHSVALELIEETDVALGSRMRWSGTISGLAPDCTYTCSFNRADDEDEFASIMVKTPAIPDGDVPTSFVPPPARGSLRPSSPATTLRNSIQTAEARLNEARMRLNKSKRTHKVALGRVEKEVDSLNARLKSSSDDTKQHQKLAQAERSIRQTKDTTNSIIAALGDLESIPEDEATEYDSKKANHSEQSKKLAAANEAFEIASAAAKQELSGVNQELTQVASRKERLITRQAKLAEQHERITEANIHGLNEKERKAAETIAAEADRQRRENDMTNGINALIHDLREVQSQIQVTYREIEVLERQALAQREMMLNNSGPLTPEGNLPGTNPPQSRAFGFSTFQPSGLASTHFSTDQQSSPFLAYANTLAKVQRPRSNTNQSIGVNSNYSADLEDADPIPPMVSTTNFDAAGMNGRKSSGSSRGKNNGSPAGVIGEGLRGPSKRTDSPGSMLVTNSW